MPRVYRLTRKSDFQPDACAVSSYTGYLEQVALSLFPERQVFTVAEVNAAIRAILDDHFQDIWISGEISGCKTSTSGHCYFTMKERDSQITCVCYRNSFRYLRCKPQDGLHVLARGRIDVYEQRGQYQFLVEAIEPQGHGALQLAFEQLKKKLTLEGLFEASRKRALPKFPRRIGIVTSPKGAVISDFIEILSRRFPGLHIRLYPALVQGDGAIEEVCRGIQYFSASGWAQVVVVARGGGSLEDLWTFNEEAVARAIANCSVPVISAIGHETDFTIADFVADLRAPTPSAAAEMVVCTRQEVLDRIAGLEHKMTQTLRYRVAMLDRRVRQQGIERALAVLHRNIGRRLQQIDDHEYRMRESLRRLIDLRRRRLQELERRLRVFDMRPRLAQDRRRLEAAEAAAVHAMQRRLAEHRRKYETCSTKLQQLSPLKILERGYAIVIGPGGEALKRPVEAGTNVRILVAEGEMRAEVR
jgi:exodeoxyribonuclease VII large subunit